MSPILLWSAVCALPPGAPVPAGVHPRLTVTPAEIEATKARAADDATVRRALEQLIGAGAAALDPPVAEAPPLDGPANDALIGRAVALGYAGVLGDREDCARRAGEILLTFADVYPTRPAEAEGRVHRYSLQEATWLCRAAVAADLVFATKALSEAERQHVVNDLLRPAAITVKTDRRSTPDRKDGHHQCYNFQAWHGAAVGMVGFVLGDQEFIDWAIDGEYGFRHMVSHDIRDDGMFWERSPGYHSFVISASSGLCEAAARAGIDLWRLQVPDDSTENEWGSGNWTLDGDNGPKSFRMMLEAPFDLCLPNLRLPAISDSSEYDLANLSTNLTLAYTRTGSKRIAEALTHLAAEAPAAPAGWRTFAPDGAPAFSGARDGERRVLAIDNGSADDRGSWVSPNVRVPETDGVLVRLRYRTIGCTAEKPFRVRVVNYHSGKADPERFAMLDFAPVEEWTEAQRSVPIPEGTEEVGLEPFLWKAAGRVEMADIEVALPDGRVLLSADEFRADSGWASTEGLPWNWVQELPDTAPPAADDTFGTTGLRRAGSSLFPATGLAVLREKWLDPTALAAVLSYGPYGGGHGHPGMLELVVADGGETVLPGLGTASYDSPLHGSWTNQTVAHNTIVVDRTTQWPRSKWGHDTAEHRVCGELLAFHADDRLQLVRARCDNAYDGIALDRTVVLADGVLLDVYRARATDGAAHRFEYVLHGLGPPTTSGMSLAPAVALGDAEGYEHLTEVRQAQADGPVSAEFGERLKLVSAPGETEVSTAMGLGISGTKPLPVLLLGRTGAEAMYVVAMQPGDDTRPVSVEVQGEQVRLSVGGRQWVVSLPEGGGAKVTCDAATWEIGAPGQPIRRTGGGADRSWVPLETGGVRVW
jgi:hypothetical protein